MNTKGNFKEIDKLIKSTYYSSEDDTIKEFLVPVLKRSQVYKRETYSFSSAIFSLINEALIEVIKNDCKIYYIVGFELDPSETAAIEEGLEEDADFIIEKQIENEFGKVENLIKCLDNSKNRNIYSHRLKVLSYLIAKRILNIKVGFRYSAGKVLNPEKHKFHPKVMIFKDADNNIIVGNGSTNESLGAHINNEESFDVFKSWNVGTEEYLKRHVEKFDQFWNNESKTVKTIEINDLIEKKILKNYKHSFKNKEDIINLEEELTELVDKNSLKEETQCPITPEKLRPYQEKVIVNWLSRGNKGIYSLATGTGKTKACIETIKRLLIENPKCIVVVVCPYVALLEQWLDVITATTNFKPMPVYESLNKWQDNLKNMLLAFKINTLESLFILTTNSTYIKQTFQDVMSKHWQHTFLIIDECHHVASPSYKGLLNPQIPYRLGLSATPENETSREGNKVLYDFFKEITPDPYSLADAIANKYLCKYDYIPVVSELNDAEKQVYESLLNDISRAKIKEDYEELNRLYERRDEILDTSNTKLPNLEKLLDKIKKDLNYAIIYCAGNEQLQLVAQLLKDKGIKFGKITASEDKKERKIILSEFRQGYIKVLLSIQVLDEGIDIPAVRTAIILKSSSRTKQSIQRRGRCLRLLRDSNGNIIEKTVSIYDFIVLPESDFSNSNINNINNTLISAEMNRIKEFIELSNNKEEALKIIEKRDAIVYVEK